MPRPAGALEDFMEATEGDGTPWSYFSASLFAREADEWGAQGHGYNWNRYEILGSDPWGAQPSVSRWRPQTGEMWHWFGLKPAQWAPEVRMGRSVVFVSFYTHYGVYDTGIYYHVDSYTPGEYRTPGSHFSRGGQVVLATGPKGPMY